MFRVTSNWWMFISTKAFQTSNIEQKHCPGLVRFFAFFFPGSVLNVFLIGWFCHHRPLTICSICRGPGYSLGLGNAISQNSDWFPLDTCMPKQMVRMCVCVRVCVHVCELNNIGTHFLKLKCKCAKNEATPADQTPRTPLFIVSHKIRLSSIVILC